eukprot:343688-Chlamydomonas_euryale.AAC.1
MLAGLPREERPHRCLQVRRCASTAAHARVSLPLVPGSKGWPPDVRLQTRPLAYAACMRADSFFVPGSGSWPLAICLQVPPRKRSTAAHTPQSMQQQTRPPCLAAPHTLLRALPIPRGTCSTRLDHPAALHTFALRAAHTPRNVQHQARPSCCTPHFSLRAAPTPRRTCSVFS